MHKESLIATVLPLSAAAGADVHVSLHIAPRLTPAGGVEPLSRFALFSAWAATASDLALAITLSDGTRLAATRVSPIVPGHWQRCFPADTPVRAPVTQDLAGRNWRSFPVRTVHDLAMAASGIATLLFPLAPPDLRDLAPRRQRESPIRMLIRGLGANANGQEPDDFAGQEAVTKALDAGTYNGPLADILKPLHAARRFYEPVGAAAIARDPHRTVAAMADPTPDFHEMVAHLSDQPRLLRMLGLVIDLKVENPGKLRTSQTLAAAISGLAGADIIAARTEIQADGDRLYARPRGDDWKLGRLRLGDAARYAALAMDSDGAALKLDNLLRSLPRLLAVADNGDAASVAPAAPRSEGFTVVRTGRLDAVKAQVDRGTAMAATATPASPPTLNAEDVTHGMRISVWDDHEQRWFSPHWRLATATASDGTSLYANAPEEGWVQTAGARETPTDPDKALHLHEAVFGWSGWSLSAPRPGPRAVPDGAAEKVEDAGPAAHQASAVAVTTKVMPGTLPRLRYGRSYAFQAWGVDIAGNAHGGAGPIAPAGPAGAAPAKAAPINTVPPTAAPTARPLADALPALRPLLARLAPAATIAPTARLAHLRDQDAVKPRSLLGDIAMDAHVTARLATRVVIPENDRASLLTATLAGAVGDLALPSLRPLPPGALQPLPGFPQIAADLVTPLVPFRRWDPVPPPVVVARHRFSPAESIHHLVIRSNVAADGTISSPAETIAATDPALAKDWQTISERHLAAPKGSQHLNELHGRFDAGIDDPARRKPLLAAALRDDGTLYDTSIIAPDDPSVRLDQPGVTLEDPADTASPQERQTALAALNGSKRGDPLPEGWYVVHDTDQMALPWLPDPLAAGIAMGMHTANRGSPLFGLFRTESTTARYGGGWPAPEPLRLMLESADTAQARVDGNVIRIGLPPGTRLDFHLSSQLERGSLPLMALWMLLPEGLRTLDLVARPAADGQFWGLTPFQPMTLVHAVTRPVLAPTIDKLVPFRQPASTSASLVGVVDVHAASTDRIEAEAAWTEWLDDLAADGPAQEPRQAVAATLAIGPEEDMVLLGLTSDDPDDGTEQLPITLPGVGTLVIHRLRHAFGDTRHRLVSYAFRGTTRFREYFPHELLATPESRSRLGEAVQLVVPSSAEPPVPQIDSILPLFRWHQEGDPGQPFGVRRKRLSGIRIYLKRPWFQTGADEQLAVLVGGGSPGNNDMISQWGGDPIWFNAGPKTRLVGLSITDLYTATLGVDGREEVDARISPAAFVPLGVGGPPMGVIGYRPEYNAQRKLWYVDVAVAPGAAVWPFVRLVVARYQPHSLPGMALSKPVTCDFVQLFPERTLTVSRPDAQSVRVTVTGPIGLRDFARGKAMAGDGRDYPLGAADPTHLVSRDRRMFAEIEERPDGSSSDLDWTVTRRQELTIGGVDAAGDWAWTGVVPLPTPAATATPGRPSDMRVTVTEEEGIDSDPGSDGAPRKGWRIVYADRIML